MNVQEPQRRPIPWPQILEAVQRVALFVLIGLAGLMVVPSLLRPFGSVLVASALTSFVAGALANVVCSRAFGRGQPADFGLAWRNASAREVGIGLAAGAGAGVVILLGALGLRVASYQAVRGAGPAGIAQIVGGIAVLAVILAFGALGEELLFHGYAFQFLVPKLGEFATVLPVGVLFGLAHAGNQNASGLSIINTMLWGILLGFAYLRTRALWMPVGLHFGWNLAISVLGFNLSGFTMGETGYALHWSAGDLWSGGGYGPEGGLATTVMVVALFFLVTRLTGQSDPGWERGS